MFISKYPFIGVIKQMYNIHRRKLDVTNTVSDIPDVSDFINDRPENVFSRKVKDQIWLS